LAFIAAQSDSSGDLSILQKRMMNLEQQVIAKQNEMLTLGVSPMKKERAFITDNLQRVKDELQLAQKWKEKADSEIMAEKEKLKEHRQEIEGLLPVSLFVSVSVFVSLSLCVCLCFLMLLGWYLTTYISSDC
jgi:chromosome segregation ATPase